MFISNEDLVSKNDRFWRGHCIVMQGYLDT